MNKIAVLYSGGRQWGGIETYLANLFESYDRSKMDLLLVSLGEWQLVTTVRGGSRGSSATVLSGKRLRARTVFELARLLRREGADLVVSQGTVANAYARLAALVARVRSLVVVHSDMKLDYPRTAVRWAYTLSDRVLRPVTKSYIAVSKYLKEGLAASGVDPARVRVIYNGVAVTGEAEVAAAPERRREGGVTLASVGRLHPVKNFDSLILALRLLPDSVRLTIWGDGSQRQRLEALAQEAGLAHRVLLAGESASMTQALAGTDIYVQPSKSEGCSFAVAEALLHGRPVVVSPCGGLPEQVEHGVTGIVAEDCSPGGLAKAVGALVDDATLAARLARAGQAAAREMYSTSRWLNETTEALCKAASGFLSV